MATTTTNLALIKPAGTDKIRIAQINSNMDILDDKIGPVGNTSLQEQLNNKQGTLIFDSVPTSGSTNPVTSSGIYTEAGNLAEAMAILSNNNTHVAISSGQYVYVRGHGTLAEGLYKATAAIAANGTLSTSNLQAVANGGLNALKSRVDTLNSNIATLESNRAYYCYRAAGDTQNFTITFGSTGETVTAFAFGRYGYSSAKLSMSIITFSSNDVYIKNFGDEALSATKNGNVITFTATSTYSRIMFISNTTMV